MDYRKTLGNATELYKRLKTAKRVSEAVSRNMVSTTFLGDDEKIRELDRLARHLGEILSDTISWKENEWVLWSGYNALVPATKEAAIRQLLGEQQACREMEEAIQGLSLMLKLLRITDNLKPQKIARAFSASLIAMNEIDREAVLTKLGGLQRGMQQAQARITNVLKALGST